MWSHKGPTSTKFQLCSLQMILSVEMVQLYQKHAYFCWKIIFQIRDSQRRVRKTKHALRYLHATYC